MKNIFPTNISRDQARDTGMAMVLILLLVGLFTAQPLYYKLAIPVLLINMIYPMFFYPIAILWFGLSHLMGSVMSKVLLTILFAVLVVPLGLLRRLMGKDAMQLKRFGGQDATAMKVRNYTFVASDLEKPF
ncbi:MAG: hypothetical protein D6730_18300 [Bacteroidetes bacterium]|nr:MAG: hypothetical protein D6730_18300 [Bacteroidota bacterium]